MSTLTEDQPKIGIFQCLDRRQLQLENMALAGIHVYSVDCFASSCQGVMQDIITGTCDRQNAIFRINTEPFDVDLWIFPNLIVS
jgi:hypothetical protein